jgi:Bacterial SH3 domain
VNRHASLLAIVLCLMPSPVAAQSTDFTVSVQSAAVRKAPSTGSPTVGQAPRGAVLEVTRDIGAWVKVAWPEAPDGVGYVHQSMGKIAQRATREERLAAAFASLPPPEPVDMPLLSADQTAASIDMSSTTRTIYVPPPKYGRSQTLSLT